MRKHYEIANFETFMPLRCMLHQLGYIEPHKHDYFEINLILSGHCTMVVDDKSYHLGPEDVISVDPYTSHELRGNDCVLICVQFEQSPFVQLLPEPQHPHFFCNSAVQGNNAAFDTIRTLIARLVKNNADKQQGYELRNCSYIYDFMDVMYNNFRISRTKAQDMQEHRYSVRIAHISRLIQEHHMENLSLSQLADMVHLSAPYLSKFFDQQFGMTFLTYLTQVRLNHAVNLLLTSNKIIEDVSAESGFPNSHAFVQAFKKEYGVLPSVYRRQNREKKQNQPVPLSVEQHDYLAGLKKYLEPVNTFSAPVNAISCNIQIDAGGDTKPLKHTWRNIMTVGCAADLLIGDIQALVRRMKKEIGFRYIKFSGIVSDEMHVYTKNGQRETYSYAYIDKVFDFLVEIGLKPIVQFSFMPSALAKDPNRRLFGQLVSEPADLSAWRKLVASVTQHLLERYGEEEVRTWHFCVWSQPDTPQSLFGFSSNEAFYEFYRQTWIAVKGCDRHLSFGTPPTFYIAESNYENWYIPFLRWCKSNGCMPDFLNFHYYDTALVQNASDSKDLFGFVYSMTLRSVPDGFGTFVNRVRSEREKLGLRGNPIFLTEWNNTPSQQDLLNDTCFKSCYIVKNILENYDKLDGFGYWSLTDWMGEAPLPKEQFFGGLGLFTVHGIPKASYYALWLLRQLDGNFVGSGDGWFATKRGETYSVLILWRTSSYSFGLVCFKISISESAFSYFSIIGNKWDL
jgi:xylan 1,4-beta-xylosidase